MSEFILFLDELETPATPLFLEYLKRSRSQYTWVGLSSTQAEFTSIVKKWGLSAPNSYVNLFAEWSCLPSLQSLYDWITEIIT